MRLLHRLSDLVAALERGLLMLLIGAVAGLVLLNVAARAVGYTLAFADELAIYAMAMAGFVGASLMLRMRSNASVLILHEVLPAGAVRGLRVAVSAVSVGFGVLLLWLCWRWFDPLALAAAGFDVATFEGATFNFIYTEVSPVLGLPMVWVFLVMPFFGLTLTIHALANLAEDCRLLAVEGT